MINPTSEYDTSDAVYSPVKELIPTGLMAVIAAITAAALPLKGVYTADVVVKLNVVVHVADATVIVPVVAIQV